MRQSQVREMAMASIRGEHPIVMGVDSFGDMTVDDHGSLFSQPQN
jgi:hypothetical protein